MKPLANVLEKIEAEGRKHNLTISTSTMSGGKGRLFVQHTFTHPDGKKALELHQKILAIVGNEFKAYGIEHGANLNRNDRKGHHMQVNYAINTEPKKK
ncbi:TPA: hypothetical protein HA244_06875 [Candidatus Micrarchaeota archaeon]|nr:hypothetical protein [Candidatus Micrarchaeota archaeon]